VLADALDGLVVPRVGTISDQLGGAVQARPVRGWSFRWRGLDDERAGLVQGALRKETMQFQGDPGAPRVDGVDGPAHLVADELTALVRPPCLVEDAERLQNVGGGVRVRGCEFSLQQVDVEVAESSVCFLPGGPSARQIESTAVERLQPSARRAETAAVGGVPSARNLATAAVARAVAGSAGIGECVTPPVNSLVGVGASLPRLGRDLPEDFQYLLNCRTERRVWPTRRVTLGHINVTP